MNQGYLRIRHIKQIPFHKGPKVQECIDIDRQIIEMRKKNIEAMKNNGGANPNDR